MTLVGQPSSAHTAIKTDQHRSGAGGFDVADNEIVRRTDPGDLVITSDIPLAAEVIDRQALALSPRGELFSKNNIGARLNMRDFLETMRGSGEHTGGPAPFSNADKKQFADQWIACSPAAPASATSRPAVWMDDIDLRHFDIQ